ncbi:hypothetical protein SALBM311S_01735 [Streptomyces alboniger]
MSGAAHWRFGNVDWKVVAKIGVPGAVGSFLGATVLSKLSTEVAEPVMSLILLGLGLYVMSASPCAACPRTGWANRWASGSSPQSVWSPGSSTRPAEAAGARSAHPRCWPAAAWSPAR